MKEAKYYEQLEKNKVKCNLCPSHCVLRPDKEGHCHTRRNIDGKLYAKTYGEVISLAMDPIEKKPLYHFYPGEQVLSIAHSGCNLHCTFCQNYTISQECIRAGQRMIPSEVVEYTKRSGSKGIAYTYTEPLIWFEFVLETAKLAHEAGLYNVAVSNGNLCEAPFRELLPHIDAFNIDVKSMDAKWYKRVCKGDLETVLRNVEIASQDAMVEVTHLLIPNQGVFPDDIHKLVDWLAGVSKEIPLHFSRYYPTYKMTEPATPVYMLFEAYEIASKKLDYVYIGNVRDEKSSTTYCPSCRKAVIRRDGYSVDHVDLQVKDGHCGYCGYELNVVR